MKQTIRILLALLVLLMSSAGAWAQAQCSLNDTDGSLEWALSQVANDETIILQSDFDASGTNYDFYNVSKSITIDVNGHTASFGNITSKYGALTITDTSEGHTGKITIAYFENQGDITIKDVEYSGYINNAGSTNSVLTFDNAKVVFSTGIQWLSSTSQVVLKNGADVEVHGTFNVAYDNGSTFTIEDDASKMRLIEGRFSGHVNISDKIRPYVRPDLRTSFDFYTDYGTTTNPFILRKTWNIELTHTFGSNATVTFFDGGTTTEPSATTFDPTTAAYADANAITKINNADGNDRYIIAHIVPAPGYWTDESLLMVMETGAAPARAKAPGLDMGQPLKLLKAGEYDAALPGDPSDMKPRHDGAGWYYYKLPGTHTVTAGYVNSTIDGYVVKHFSFSDDDPNATIAQDFDNNTVTVGRTTDDWTAVLTYDKFSWVFDGTLGSIPHVQSISIQKGGTELLNMTDATTIDFLVDPNYTAGMPHIGYNDLKPAAGEYGWFVGRDDRYIGQTLFMIKPPFQPVDPTQPSNTWGSLANPWAIANATDLNMLAKCVNVGSWNCFMQYFRQTANIVYNAAANAAFEPIGADNYCADFEGHFDGYSKTITGIDYTCNKPKDSDGTEAYVGLFGRVFGTSDFPSSVQNVTLIDCKFRATDASCAVAVGSVIAFASGMGTDNVVITGCKVLATSDGSALVSSLSSDDCATGAIVGACSTNTSKLENNYYGYGVTVTNTSGTASGYTKRGTEVVTSYDPGTDTYTYAWGDVTANDGAMLYVKKASIAGGTTANGSTVTFNEVTKGTDRYDKDGDDFYYAVGQPVTLSVTLKDRTETTDIRTFYDELKALTMNDGTTETDIKDALGFTMPEADATVTATIDESKWFTIETNQEKWMSFYHEWMTDGDATTAPANANYTVTDATGKEEIEVLTIKGVNLLQGTVTTDDLSGTSYNGMPTLFHCESGLPAKLKFTPDANASTNVTAYENFKGTTGEKDMREFTNVYVMNAIGDFYYADIASDDYTLKAHRCYIALGNIAVTAPARLRITSGDDTGIDALRTDSSDSDARWFTIDGRRMEGRPQQKGIYINGDRKVVIK